MKQLKIKIALLLLIGFSATSYASTPMVTQEDVIESYTQDLHEAPVIEMVDKLDDGDQCTARVTMKDGTVYEVTADSCIKAFVYALALAQADLEE